LLNRLAFSPGICVTASFFGAALWACHPIQVQSVTYVVQRMTSMAALFTILTVLFYVLGRQSSTVLRRWLFYGSGIVWWVFGLASKENAAVAPFLVLLVEYGVLRHGERMVRSRLDVGLLFLPVALALFVVIDIASGVGPLSQALIDAAARHRDAPVADTLAGAGPVFAGA
jgi:hypothetical protein